MTEFLSNLWQDTKNVASSATDSVTGLFKKKPEDTTYTGGSRHHRRRRHHKDSTMGLKSLFGLFTRKRGHSHTRRHRGGSPPAVPFSSEVWNIKHNPYPQAVNANPTPLKVGGRHRRKHRGGSCSAGKVVPFSSNVWSIQAPITGGTRRRRRH